MENIVTNIVWHTADERPAHSGCYLVYCSRFHYSYGYVTSVEYSKRYDMFNAHDSSDLEQAQRTSIDIAAWAEMPKELEELNNDDE